MKIVYYLILSISLLSLSLSAGAQCAVPSPPVTPACGAPGQTLLSANGTTINSGSTYFYNGGAHTFSTFTLNGGTLLVCGTMTLNFPTMWSGTIVVESGATLTISDIPVPTSGATNAIQATIVNYGTLNIKAITNNTAISVNASVWNYGTMTAGATLTFNSNPFYNALSTSSATFSGGLISYAPVVNNGNMTVSEKWTTTSSVCLGGGSQTSTDSLFDDGGSNQFTVTGSPSNGKAGLNVPGWFNSNTNPLTGTNSLVLCEGPTMVNSTGNAGSATVQPNCTQAVLPVVLLMFTAETESNNTCTLQWTTAQENGVKDFVLEYSLDGKTFEALTDITAHNAPSNYSYNTILQGQTWFRLRVENVDGTYQYSPVVLADYIGEKNPAPYSVKLQPNLITNNTLTLWTSMQTAQSGEWIVVDMTGRELFHQGVQLNAGTSNITLQVPNLPSGMYRLLFLGSQIRVTPVPFSVIR